MDRFKNVNDRLGHEAGDTLLRSMANNISSQLRAEDVVARFGGDEFLILVNNVHNTEDIAATAQKILRAVNAPIKLGGHTLHPSVSIGVSMYPNDGLDLDTLKRSADAALYRAKENGRNRFSIYDHTFDRMNQAERFTLENELREALSNEQIVVYYQPIVSLQQNRLVAVEALARWEHPNGQLLQPHEFISLAEETGLISELDRCVFRQVCIQIKKWQALGLPRFRVAVNLSAQQFSEPEFFGRVSRTLKDIGTDPNLIEMEITESMAMGNVELADMNLKDLKKLGVHMTIDDFGTGYSSLNYLKRFPIDGLKIDQSFIKQCMTVPADMSITKTIVAMAETLNLQVVAEGVEGPAQLEFLRDLGCDAAQGFYIAEPMTAEALAGWIHVKYPTAEEVVIENSTVK